CEWPVVFWDLSCVQSRSSPVLCPQSWSSPVPCSLPCKVHSLCLQSMVISCTMSAVSGHLLYYVRSLWSSPVLCLQSMVISCTVSAVLVISCTMSAVS
ncbi:unnamed protein product, partial [Staurois parvus]